MAVRILNKWPIEMIRLAETPSGDFYQDIIRRMTIMI